MKNAKKILAILLVLCMAFALVACGEKDPPVTTGDAPANTDSAAPGNTGDTPAAGGPKEIGFYDRDYDYTQHEKFRFAYLVSATGVMYDSFDTAFQTWAERLNMDYGGMWAPAEASNEAFLAGVEQYADMGYSGLIIDADPNLCARIAEICAENEILWMMGMAQARDYSMPYSLNGSASIGPLLAPNVGFNNTAVGRTLAEGLIQWKEDTYPDVAWEKVGFISIDFSLSPQIAERTLGAKQVWAENNPSFGEYNPDPNSALKNFIIADAASGAFNQETATNLVTQVLSNPPDPGIEVWLISASFWDFAAGAAVSVQNMNLVEKSCITTFGAGANSIALWDTGEETPIRIALETASPVFAESIVNAMWAMMAGFATPDTLWPEWICIWDKGDVFTLTEELDPISQTPLVEVGEDGTPVATEEHSYASMILPMIWTSPENYQEFYGWVDLYDLGPDAAEEDRTYPQYPLGTDMNAFSARGTVPDNYGAYPTAD